MSRKEEGSEFDVITRSALNARRHQQCNGLPNISTILIRYNNNLVGRYTFSARSCLRAVATLPCFFLIITSAPLRRADQPLFPPR